MKYQALVALLGYASAAKLNQHVAHKLRDDSADLPSPTFVNAPDGEPLPETVAPKKTSTLERRTDPEIPANPIYDLEYDIEHLPTKADFRVSGYNGADEDEIMDKVIKEYSVNARDSTNNKTGQKMLSKEKARRAAEVILEATHKLKENDVEPWVQKNFENSWNHFDQNHEGYLRYEETHTFMRHLMGHLNKFSVAPGSITDITSGGKAYKLSPAVERARL